MNMKRVLFCVGCILAVLKATAGVVAAPNRVSVRDGWVKVVEGGVPEWFIILCPGLPAN
jgi:hypothetical protein